MAIRFKLNEILSFKRDMPNQTKLAEDLNISRNALRNLLETQPVQIRLDTIESLCRILHVTPNDLFEVYDPQYALHVTVKRDNTIVARDPELGTQFSAKTLDAIVTYSRNHGYKNPIITFED